MTPAERLALFTTPTSALGAAKDGSAAGAWVRWGRGQQWTDATASPRLALTMRAWSWPVYRGDRAVTRIRVWRSPAVWDEAPRWSTVPTSRWPVLLPWAPEWRPASEGEDGGILIDDDGTGAEGWEVLNLRPASWLDALALAFRTGFQARAGDWVCDQLQRRTKLTAGTYDGRGMGKVPKRVGIVTADEVLSGDIGHALALTGLTQFGPGARFVAPATRVEHPGTPPKTYPLAAKAGNDARILPHGTRLALAVTDAEIAAWCQRRGHVGAAAQTATTFVRALRDWGMVLCETGTGDPQVECSGLVGPDAGTWRALGVTDANAVTLLDGLPWTRLYVVAVPS